MRLALLTIAVGLAGASGAAAQSLTPLALTPKSARAANIATVLNDAAFAPKRAAADVDPGAKFVERDAYALGEGPVQFRSGEVRLSSRADGVVDSVRVNIAGVLRTPGGLPLNLERGAFDARDVDVTLVRRWPKAVSFSSDSLDIAIAPHAGFGVSRYGGQAEGGATLTVSGGSRTEKAKARLRELGVKDGDSYGQTGRWYMFAAANGRAVGLNMMHNEQGWNRDGWSTDATGALVGDAQVGVGWRKGQMQSSFGVIHREVKGQHMVFGQTTRDDTVAAFTFSLRPGQ